MSCVSEQLDGACGHTVHTSYNEDELGAPEGRREEEHQHPHPWRKAHEYARQTTKDPRGTYASSVMRLKGTATTGYRYGPFSADWYA